MHGKKVIELTIIYTKHKFPPPPFDEEVAEMHYYRHLYKGEHEEIFPRARTVTTEKRYIRKRVGRRYKTVERQSETFDPYVVVNFSSLIAEVPADLINRAVGNISADTEEDNELLAFVKDVAAHSGVNKKVWAAVTQHQVDGLIAYRIRRDEQAQRTWFEWLVGDRFFPHEDDLGADVAWIEEWGEDDKKDKYLRVERQRIEAAGLKVEQLVFKFEGDNVGDKIDIKEYAQQYELTIPEETTLEGVTELMCGYIANEETLLDPRGRSALRNIDTIQEEINWTITRDSIVFEKHGKPKLAIPRKLWDSVANDNQKNYGGRFVRNADLEVVSYDENNGAVPMYIVWDAKTEESFKHVTRLIQYMLAVSKTSSQATGLGETAGSLSAKAILYEWIQSVIKAEAIKDKFDAALKDAIRKCIILENALGGKQMEAKAPVIEWGDMLPKAESEKATEESDKYEKGVQSLETTIRRIHPDWSDKAIEEEIQKIREDEALDTLNPANIQPPKVTLGDG